MKKLILILSLSLFSLSASALPPLTTHGFRVIDCNSFDGVADLVDVGGFYTPVPPHEVTRLVIKTESNGTEIVNRPENIQGDGEFIFKSNVATLIVDGKQGEFENGFPSTLEYRGEVYTGFFCKVTLSRPN